MGKMAHNLKVASSVMCLGHQSMFLPIWFCLLTVLYLWSHPAVILHSTKCTVTLHEWQKALKAEKKIAGVFFEINSL